MNEVIRKIKIDTLEKLKQYKQAVENQRDTMLQSKFNERKAKIDEDYVTLDNAFAKYKQEKLTSVNADIEKRQEEVAKKKALILEEAKKEIETEVDNAIAMLSSEYNIEIAKLEKELG